MIQEMISLMHLQINIFFLEMQKKMCITDLKYQNQNLKKYGDKEPDTTDMSELESEKSAEQKRQRLKILTPNQMLIRLPISLAQLKARNNSKKLKNEIRQLFYSLCRSNILKTEKIFMNTENSKTNL